MKQTIEQRFAEAYQIMTKKVKYRPEAPSDGVGNIELNEDEINDDGILIEEALRYASKLKQEDDEAKFTLYGCTNWEYNRLFVYLLNASQLCCSNSEALLFIKRLLSAALDETAKIEEERKHRYQA